MVTKVAKIEIKRPLNVEKRLFKEFMKDMQYQAWKMANKGIQLFWDYQNFDYSYKEKFGQHFFKANDSLPNGYKLIGDIRNELKDISYILPSDCKDAMIRMIEQKWKSDLKSVLKGEKSIASFKRNLPIELHNKQIVKNKTVRIYNENKKYTTLVTLLAADYARTLGLKDGNILLELIVKDDYLKAIVDRLISGDYKLSMSKMQYDERKDKWFLLLAYTFIPEKKILNENKILGVDLGVNIPAMCAVNGESTYLSIGNRNEIERFEKEIYNKKKELQKASIWSSDGAIGHGTKRRLKRLEKISSRIANYKKTKNHSYSRAVIDFALQNQCGTIQLEDLAGISTKNKLLKNWTYFDLQEKITNKAREHGINVVKIKAAYTSQRCYKCGFIHSEIAKEQWRPVQDTFYCVNCNLKTNADLNAARNISIKDIEVVIKEQLIKQEKTINHKLTYEV